MAMVMVAAVMVATMMVVRSVRVMIVRVVPGRHGELLSRVMALQLEMIGYIQPSIKLTWFTEYRVK